VLAILPFLAFILLVALFWAHAPDHDFRRGFLRACIGMGAYTTLLVEVLSLIKGITPLGLAAGYGFLIMTLSIILLKWRIGGVPREEKSLSIPLHSLGLLERALVSSIFLIAFATLLVSLIYPPQAYEILRWQMSRVAHWAQQASLVPFATGVENQNTMAPGAQIPLLVLYVLARGDYLVNIVPWSAMVGSVVASTWIAANLGGDRRTQIFAGLFVATIPLGIAMASSPEMEYVLAFYVMCAISESIPLLQGRSSRGSMVFAGAAAALAILAKVTAVVWLMPFAFGIAVAFILRKSYREAVISLAIAMAAIGTINAGYVFRAYQVMGGILEPAQVSIHNNRRKDIMGLVSNMLRNGAHLLGTGDERINRQMYRAIQAVHYKLGMDINDPETTAHGDFHITRLSAETGTSSPVHAWLILGSMLWVLVGRRGRNPYLMSYGLMGASTYVVFCLMFRWQPFGNRYLLPFLVIMAPFAGNVLIRGLPSYMTMAVSGILLALAWQPLVHMETRPLLTPENPIEGIRAVLESRIDYYFSGLGNVWDGYVQATEEIEASSCSSIGIMISGAWPSAEYPIWVLLDAPRPDLEVQWIVAGTPSARFMKEDFAPCAIICDWSCPTDWQDIRGLPLYERYGEIRLYMRLPR